MTQTELDTLTQTIRETIDTQVRTTPSGRALSKYDPTNLEWLIKNIVGNLAMVMADEIENAKENAK